MSRDYDKAKDLSNIEWYIFNNKATISLNVLKRRQISGCLGDFHVSDWETG